MADPTPADALERLVVYTAMTDAQLAMDCERVIKPLISIAARVLDEGAVERLTKLMLELDSGPVGSAIYELHDGEFGVSYRKAAQAVINYLLEGKE